MIYYYLGNDYSKINKAVEKVILEKGATETLNFLEEKEISFLGDYLYDEDIFGNTKAIVCRYCLENTNSLDYVVEKSSDLKSAKNIFIFIEKKTRDKEKAKKLADHFFEFDIREVAGVSKTFLLASLIEKKDRKGAWFCLQDIKNDYAIENTLGIIKWKLLTMLSGYKYRSDYEREKLVVMLRDVVFMFNDIHTRINIDGYNELESWIFKYL